MGHNIGHLLFNTGQMCQVYRRLRLHRISTVVRFAETMVPDLVEREAVLTDMARLR